MVKLNKIIKQKTKQSKTHYQLPRNKHQLLADKIFVIISLYMYPYVCIDIIL